MSGNFSTGKYGFQDFSGLVRMSRDEAGRYTEFPQAYKITIAAGGVVAWEGRVEDLRVTSRGVEFKALGYWSALADLVYTSLWSDTRVGEFQPLTNVVFTGTAPELYEMDKNNRLFIGLRTNQTYTNAERGRIGYVIPHRSLNSAAEITFTYEFLAPNATWKARFFYAQSASGFNSAWATTVLPAGWPLSGSGVIQSGTTTIALTNAQGIVFDLYYDSGVAYTHTGDNGQYYFKITSIRIKSVSGSVLSSAIAADVASKVNGLNSTALSSSTAKIVTTKGDLFQEVYEDENPQDILRRLAFLEGYEVGVYDGQILHYRPAGSGGQTWYISLNDLEVESTLSGMYNQAYAIYKEPSGFLQRLADVTDGPSVSRYGVTKEYGLQTKTTSSTEATNQRDLFLSDFSKVYARGDIAVRRVMDMAGSIMPAWVVRAGDTIILRDLPPNMGTAVDNVRQFVVGETRYNMMTGELFPFPEEPLPQLEQYLAKREAGIPL
jgi:hypothetical protein